MSLLLFLPCIIYIAYPPHPIAVTADISLTKEDSSAVHCTMCRLGSMIPLYKLVPRTIYRGIKNSTVHIQGHNRFPCIFTEETTQFLFFGSIFTQPDIFFSMIWYLLVVFISFWVSKHHGGCGIFYYPVYLQGNKRFPCTYTGEFFIPL